MSTDTDDMPNPQGLPRFVPPVTTAADMNVRCVVCEGIEPVKLECWDEPAEHCTEYGAVLPDASIMILGTDEAKAEEKARHMAECLREGMLTPSEAWEGGLGAALCDWNT